jgi:hypothetical protein
VFCPEGTLTLTRSTVSANSAQASATGSSADVPSVALSYGGGVRAQALVIVDSTISGNSTHAYAINAGGSAYAYSKGGGAATWGNAGSLSLTNSTISGNSTAWQGDASTYGFAIGGGLFAWGNAPVLANSTITANVAEAGGGVFLYATPAMTSNSTIVASNIVAADGYEVHSQGAATVNGANNLIASANADATLPGDTLSRAPLLGPLANNGGPTRTHALLSGSPAIDTGNNVAALAFDQRGEGFPGDHGDSPDIGAVEQQPWADRIFADGFDS